MYEIIDSHAHIYPLKIAEKATKTIGEFYGIKMNNESGTSELLLKLGREAGVSKYIVHSTATTLHQVRSINNYIYGEMTANPEFIGFMTLHPDMEQNAIREEIDYCVEKGFKGIKLHPDFQKFQINEERAQKIYKEASDRLPILFHTGDRRYNFSNPPRLAEMARKFPHLTVIGAHFGGFSEWEKVDCYKGLKNIYFDTSSSLPFLSPERAVNLIRSFGVEWFLFGTDFPMWSPREELNRFLSLPLAEDERKAILSQNAKRLLNL